MTTADLHDKFLKTITAMVPKKSELAALVARNLRIERDAAYRRLSGKVAFTVREIGILAEKMNISLDQLLHPRNNLIMLPFMPESPMKGHSMDSLYDIVERSTRDLSEITKNHTDAGNIVNTFPVEFFLFSPVLSKFMFFKWGYYFVGSEDFNNFSTWELSPRVPAMLDKIIDVYKFDKCYYVWDESLVWTLCREINNFYKMNIITVREKEEIALALKDLLTKMEMTLNETYSSKLLGNVNKLLFYISSVNLGFNSHYYHSKNNNTFTFHTNFSFSVLKDSPENFHKLKDWVDSFRTISMQLSQSGRMERRMFFDIQYKIIDQLIQQSDIAF